MGDGGWGMGDGVGEVGKWGSGEKKS